MASKGIGARRRVILTQFLIESTVISFLGIFGVLAASCIALQNYGVTPVLARIQFRLPWARHLRGIVAGLPGHPRASLRPIDALRYNSERKKSQ